jgi:hypothetical protein
VLEMSHSDFDKNQNTIPVVLSGTGSVMHTQKTSSQLLKKEHADVLRLAVNIFVKMEPNALGKAAYLLDPTGKFYNDATNHKSYYPRPGDVIAIKNHKEQITNRAHEVKHAIVIGQGPADVFQAKEVEILKGLRKLEKITTIDLSSYFNEQADEVVQKLSAKIKRPIEFNSITADYRTNASYLPLHTEGEPALVICTGGLITNTESKNRDDFPSGQFKRDLKSLAKIAGKDGYVLVTYDSSEKIPLLLKAYDTKELKNLFLNVIDVIAKTCPEFEGLHRDNFEVVSSWNPTAMAIDHKLVVKKDMHFVVPYKNGHPKEVTYTVNLLKGSDIHALSSYKPHVEEVAKTARCVGLKTLISSETRRGPTVHMFKNTRH